MSTVYLEDCNLSELVQLARSYGVSTATHTWPREELLAVCSAPEQVRINKALAQQGAPFDPERREIMEFIAQYREHLEDQLRCDGNCFAHDDAQVMWCWLNCMQHIEHGLDT